LYDGAVRGLRTSPSPASSTPRACLASASGDATADGFPVGVQLIAPFGRDWDLMSIAKVYETAYPWSGRWPRTP
jgi:Asp-tRNA(Asn)/Glu-tRNA(Gln) amidotransferase A subunit family amidase